MSAAVDLVIRSPFASLALALLALCLVFGAISAVFVIASLVAAGQGLLLRIAATRAARRCPAGRAVAGAPAAAAHSVPPLMPPGDQRRPSTHHHNAETNE
jgi:hypothetical protein